jgi:hypothetical protein
VVTCLPASCPCSTCALQVADCLGADTAAPARHFCAYLHIGQPPVATTWELLEAEHAHVRELVLEHHELCSSGSSVAALVSGVPECMQGPALRALAHNSGTADVPAPALDVSLCHLPSLHGLLRHHPLLADLRSITLTHESGTMHADSVRAHAPHRRPPPPAPHQWDVLAAAVLRSLPALANVTMQLPLDAARLGAVDVLRALTALSRATALTLECNHTPRTALAHELVPALAQLTTFQRLCLRRGIEEVLQTISSASDQAATCSAQACGAVPLSQAIAALRDLTHLHLSRFASDHAEDSAQRSAITSLPHLASLELLDRMPRWPCRHDGCSQAAAVWRQVQSWSDSVQEVHPVLQHAAAASLARITRLRLRETRAYLVQLRCSRLQGLCAL